MKQVQEVILVPKKSWEEMSKGMTNRVKLLGEINIPAQIYQKQKTMEEGSQLKKKVQPENKFHTEKTTQVEKKSSTSPLLAAVAAALAVQKKKKKKKKNKNKKEKSKKEIKLKKEKLRKLFE